MEWMLELVADLSAWQICAVLFGLILASGLCLFSEDLTIVVAGLLVYREAVPLAAALPVCIAAVLLADSMLWGLGRWLGMAALERSWLGRLLPARKRERARELVERHGARLVPAIRFMPGLRAPLTFACGGLGLGYTRFLVADALAATVEVGLLLLAAYWAGDGIAALMSLLAGLEYGLLLVGGGLLIVAGAWLVRRRTAARRAAV